MPYGRLIECPVEGCLGFYATTSDPNIAQHIRKRGAEEALLKYLLGKRSCPHAQYLKERITIETQVVQKITLGDKKTILLKLGIKE